MKVFMHVNGVTYELANSGTDEAELRDRLHEQAPSQMVEVRIDGVPVWLRVYPHAFATFAVWTTEDGV